VWVSFALDKWDDWMSSVEHAAATVILLFRQASLRKNKKADQIPVQASE